ncbi:MAG: PTS sugar transporter subunit IIB, partial [Gemmatimonadales bacterium]
TRLPELEADGHRVLVLTGDRDTMAALYSAVPTVVKHINLGGVHHRAGRRERLPYLYLSDEELRNLLTLEEAGAEISAQDLPTTQPVALKGLT